MSQRNASVAVIGAGDFIGAAICKRFAAEGYHVHGGRRPVSYTHLDVYKRQV